MRHSIAGGRLRSLSLQDHRTRRGREGRHLLLCPLRERIRSATSKRSGLIKSICRGGRTTERLPQSKRTREAPGHFAPLFNRLPGLGCFIAMKTQIPTIGFRYRREAGRVLASHFRKYAGHPNVVVLALPRGGVPVAYEVAKELGAPLDVFIVRKLGVPGYEELAMGAIASGGVRVLNESVVAQLPDVERALRYATAHETRELERREAEYRDGRPAPDLRGLRPRQQRIGCVIVLEPFLLGDPSTTCASPSWRCDAAGRPSTTDARPRPEQWAG